MVDEPKVSVYIALAAAALVSSVDLVANGSVEASQQIALAFIAFAGLRQAIKSGLKR